jgi:hypothetical protein
MKRAATLCALLAVAFALWQRHILRTLRETEARILAYETGVLPSSAAPAALAVDHAPVRKLPLLDAELPPLLDTLRNIQIQSTSPKAPQNFYARLKMLREKYPGVLDTITRLTPEQMRSLFLQWLDAPPPGFSDGIDENPPHPRYVASQVLLLGQVNPVAALEFAADPPPGLRIFQDMIFQNWFLDNPDALLAWVESWQRRAGPNTPKNFRDNAIAWAGLARAIRDPGGIGAEEYARHIGRTSVFSDGLPELAAKLEGTGARLAFLRALHTAGEGNGNVSEFFKTVATTSSFEQASYLADHAPTFKPRFPYDLMPESPTSNARYAVALHSRDRTPLERWTWLTRDGFLPDADAVRTLIYTWATHDDEGTIAWLESLPPGPTRDTAHQQYKAWKRDLGSGTP